ncbi:hypothetical protein FRB90_011323 [Tulasnella sp. 427]|nr:hypothetical protein FRB90_011323 [Tulasnella sp. 427]
MRLDGSVKTNLDLLVQAMFKQYPPVPEEFTPNPNEVEISTPVCPAASTVTLPANQATAEETIKYDRRTKPSQASTTIQWVLPLRQIASPLIRADNPVRAGRHVGRPRIVYNDGAEPAYLWRGLPDSLYNKILAALKHHAYPLGLVTFDR